MTRIKTTYRPEWIKGGYKSRVELEYRGTDLVLYMPFNNSCLKWVLSMEDAITLGKYLIAKAMATPDPRVKELQEQLSKERHENWLQYMKIETLEQRVEEQKAPVLLLPPISDGTSQLNEEIDG